MSIFNMVGGGSGGGGETGCYGVNLLVVGGGGGSRGGCYVENRGTVDCYNNGGGGGEVLCCICTKLNNATQITIGCGGGVLQDGGDTCVGKIVAHGGKSNGTSGSGVLGGKNYINVNNTGRRAGGGGAGASRSGTDGSSDGTNGGTGGDGLYGYGGGGGGGGYYNSGDGKDGGGSNGGSATGYGGGGASRCNPKVAGGGCQGVVDVCYRVGYTNFCCATGGNCCYTCDGYCVHRFTSNGTFCVVC